MTLENLKITTQLDLVTQECCNCHMIFAIPADFKRRAKEDTSIYFHCPAGHPQHFSKSRLAELEAELANKAHWLKYTEERLAEARRNCRKEQTERKKLRTRHEHLRERVKNGVCPCCRRSFGNLQRHMQTKHPGFTTQEGAS